MRRRTSRSTRRTSACHSRSPPPIPARAGLSLFPNIVAQGPWARASPPPRARSICWTVCVYLMSTYVRSLAAKKCFEGLSDRNTPRRRTAASKCCHTPAMTAATHFVMTSGGCGGAHITKRRHPARPSAMLPGRLRTAPKTPVNVASRRKCLTVVANVVPQGDALPPPAVFNVSRSVSTDCPYSHDALVKLN